MLVLNVTYITNGAEGAREALVQELNENGLLEAIRKEDGCIQYKFYLGMDDEKEVAIVENWENDEKAAAHQTAPHMDAFRAIKGKYVVDTTIHRAHC